jgi:hypothetical protein
MGADEHAGQPRQHAPDSLAFALAGMPEVWARLLVEHVPDRYGRCVACASSRNAGTLWPCTLQVTAADARVICLGPESDPADAVDGPGTAAGRPPAADTPCGAAC